MKLYVLVLLMNRWEDHAEYMKFRESEVPDGWVAQIISALADKLKFSWSEVQGSWH